MSEFKEFGKIARLNRDVVITEKIDGTNAQILIEPIELETPDTLDADGNVVMGQAGRGGNVAVGDEVALVRVGELAFGVLAGKRTSWVHPRHGKNWDNYGFGTWVTANAVELVALLGPGKHFGEWWGAGVQRKYGQVAKRFSLFNVSRYGKADAVLDARCIRPAVPHGPEADVDHKFHKGVKMCACRPAQEAISATIGGVLIEPVPVLYRGPWFVPKDSTPCTVCPGGLPDPRVRLRPVWAPEWALQKLANDGSVAAPGFMDPEGICVFHEASGTLFKATIKGDEKPKGQQ